MLKVYAAQFLGAKKMVIQMPIIFELGMMKEDIFSFTFSVYFKKKTYKY